MEEKSVNIEKKEKKGAVHFLLAHAYLLFFIAIILGVIFDSIIKVNLLENFIYSNFGLILIIFGSSLTYWAQKSSSSAGKIVRKKSSTEGFSIGPYKYFRNPTYLGLFTMTLGFGILIKSVFCVLFVLITYLIIKIIFVKKEEEILEEKYGETYTKYKEIVKDRV